MSSPITPPRRPHPLVLLILDGWGYRTDTDYNAIAQAHTPTWDNLWAHYPHTLLSANAADVGLPEGQMGNSEVGHLHMGAGRIVTQDLERINQSIRSNAFFNNPVLEKAARQVANQGTALHLIGLLSDGGVHSHINHFKAAVALAARAGVKQCFIHAILDGRDTPPKEALNTISAFEATIAEYPGTRLVSLIGRYFAMDRDKRWQRTEKAYNLLAQAQSPYTALSATEGILQAYERGESDEFIQATTIVPSAALKNGDAVFLMNFRADRLRQLTRALTHDSFDGFTRATPPPALSACVSLTTYADDIPTQVAFPRPPINNTLGEYLAAHNLRQLRLAETEKYAHVTFFFNGGIESPFPHETRLLVPSPKVATYDQQPEMSAYPLTEKLKAAIASQQYDVIIGNYANADMVGHSGNFQATLKAIETIDHCLAQIITTLKQHRGALVITADHGNAELMYNPDTQQAHTAHTDRPVPCLYIDCSSTPPPSWIPTTQQGKLYDIAPTLLHLLGLKPPPEMTGTPLFRRQL